MGIGADTCTNHSVLVEQSQPFGILITNGVSKALDVPPQKQLGGVTIHILVSRRVHGMVRPRRGQQRPLAPARRTSLLLQPGRRHEPRARAGTCSGQYISNGYLSDRLVSALNHYMCILAGAGSERKFWRPQIRQQRVSRAAHFHRCDRGWGAGAGGE